MSFYVGNKSLSGANVGSKVVTDIYLGNKLLWHMAKEISVTVYGSVSEKVTLASDIGTFTIVTNSSGIGTGKILAIPNKTVTYTVTGAISGYSRTISVTTSTSAIYAMPDGALYWHGNTCTWNTGGVATVNNWIFSTSSVSDDDYDKICPTFNTNSMYFPKDVCTAVIYAPANTINLTNWTYLKIRVTACTVGSDTCGHIGVDNNYNAAKSSATKYVEFNSTGVFSLNISDITARQYIYAVVANAGTSSSNIYRTATVTEFWLE